MSIIHRIVSTTIVPSVLVLAAAGCDDMVEVASDPDGYHEERAEEGEEPDGGFWGDEVEGVRGEEAPEVSEELSEGEAPVSESNPVYFRLMSEQVRFGTNKKLCFEPLEDVSGAPLVQKECNNSGLGPNNRQAFHKTPNLGNRIQYVVKDKQTGLDLCVHMAGGPPALSNGVVAVLFQCDGTRPNQVFYNTDPDPAGGVALIAQHSHRCLTVFGGLDSDLAILYQFDLYPSWACDKAHQRWILKTDAGTNYDWANKAPNPWTAPACVL